MGVIPDMGKMTKVPLTLLLLAALFAATISCESKGSDNLSSSGNTGGRRQRGQSNTAFPVKGSPVVKRGISEYLITNTTVEAERIIDVVAEASGTLVQVYVEEGEWVSTGTVLARSDQKEIKLELKEATLELDEKQRSFERTTELRKNNIVSEEDYQTQKYQLELAKIRLEQAKLKLDNTEILAPIDGVVTHRLISTGDSFSSNQKLFTIGDFNPLLATIHIPEKELSKVKIGQRVTIQAESAQEQEFKGIVRRISPIVDAASGTVKITIEISPPAALLRPGMFITVFLAVATHENALIIPKKALVLEKEQEVVFVAREGKAVRTPVSLGFSDSDSVEVTSGLAMGDTVIVVGQEGIQDGSTIRLVSGEGEGGRRDGGFDIAQMPPERRKRLEKRLLGNPKIKEEYERRIKTDPDLDKNDDKRISFFKEMMDKYPRTQ